MLRRDACGSKDGHKPRPCPLAWDEADGSVETALPCGHPAVTTAPQSRALVAASFAANLEAWDRGIVMEGVTIIQHPLVQHKLTLMRDKSRSTKSFRELCRELGILMCYEVTRDLPLGLVEIDTPMARMMAPRIAGKKLVFAPILRAGMALVEGMSELVPSARVSHIGLYRDPETLVAVEYFFKAPIDVAERLVIVVQPVIATANTAVAAVDRLKERGARDIRYVCLITVPTALERLRGIHPDVHVWTAAIDERLDDDAFIVPGLGDAGDRAYGTR
jgi:uracil phosphoribosyltransferase